MAFVWMWREHGLPVLWLDSNRWKELEASGDRIYIVRGNCTEGYFSKQLFDESGEAGLRLIKDWKRCRRLFSRIEWDEREGRDFFDFLSNIDLKQKSDEELSQLFQKLHKLYQGFVNYYDFSEPERFYPVEEEIKKEITKKVKDEKLVNEHLAALTTPFKKHFFTMQEIEWFRLLKEIEANQQLMNLFHSDVDSIEQSLNSRAEFSQINSKINSHLKKYELFMAVDERPFWDKTFFLHQIKKVLLEEKKDIEGELKKIEQRYENLEGKKTKSVEELGLPKETVEMCDLVREHSFVRMNLRPYWTMSTIVGKRLLLPEISKRLSLSITQLENCSFEEIQLFLKGEKPVPLTELDERAKLNVILFRNRIDKILTGEKAEKIVEELKPKEKKVVKLKGTPASIGKVTGIVRVISYEKIEEMSKKVEEMQQGEIIVTEMTRPNLLIICQKAKAIVTDEGGIICHAAIVARELGIPCVTATKVATKVLKDGDKVEVDAEKGIVRKVS